jgi:hypothetical protein
MARVGWDGQNNLLGLYSSFDQALDATVGVQASTVDDAVLDSFSVGQNFNQGAVFS